MTAVQLGEYDSRIPHIVLLYYAYSASLYIPLISTVSQSAPTRKPVPYAIRIYPIHTHAHRYISYTPAH